MRLSTRNSIILGVLCTSSTIFGSDATAAVAGDDGNQGIKNKGTAAKMTDINTETKFETPQSRDLRTKTNYILTADRIVNGEEAIPGRYSYMTFLKFILTEPDPDVNPVVGRCGGSLITRDIILTAAHCIDGLFAIAVIGAHNVADPAENNEVFRIEMDQILIHPDYSNETSPGRLYDAALFVLPQETSQDVELVTLNQEGPVPAPGDPLTSIGWGKTIPQFDNSISDKLMEADLASIDNVQCFEDLELFYSLLNEERENGGLDPIPWTFSSPIEFNTITCATDDFSSTCQGDSGGPLFIPGMDESGADDVQVGIVSWGSPVCNLLGVDGVPPPGAYTRVSEVYDWIRSNVCELSSNPPDSFNCPPDVGDLPGAPDDDGPDDGGDDDGGDDDTSSSSKSSKSAKSSDDDDDGGDDDDDDDDDSTSKSAKTRAIPTRIFRTGRKGAMGSGRKK